MQIRRRKGQGTLTVSPANENSELVVYIREAIGRGRERDVQTVCLTKAELERVVDELNDFSRGRT